MATGDNPSKQEVMACRKEINSRDWAILTAFKSEIDGRPVSIEENRERNRELLKSLRGKRVLDLEGWWVNPGSTDRPFTEESFFVHSIDRARTIALGEDFIQESVIVRDSMGCDLVNTLKGHSGSILLSFNRVAFSKYQFVGSNSRFKGMKTYWQFLTADGEAQVMVPKPNHSGFIVAPHTGPVFKIG